MLRASHEHVTLEPYGVMGRSSSFYVTTLPSLLANGIVVVEIYNYFMIRSFFMKSPPFQVWWPSALWYLRYTEFSLPCDLARQGDERPM